MLRTGNRWRRAGVRLAVRSAVLWVAGAARLGVRRLDAALSSPRRRIVQAPALLDCTFDLRDPGVRSASFNAVDVSVCSSLTKVRSVAGSWGERPTQW